VLNKLCMKVIGPLRLCKCFDIYGQPTVHNSMKLQNLATSLAKSRVCRQSNWSTSNEALKDIHRCPWHVTFVSDVYSFGMVCWDCSTSRASWHTITKLYTSATGNHIQLDQYLKPLLHRLLPSWNAPITKRCFHLKQVWSRKTFEAYRKKKTLASVLVRFCTIKIQ